MTAPPLLIIAASGDLQLSQYGIGFRMATRVGSLLRHVEFGNYQLFTVLMSANVKDD